MVGWALVLSVLFPLLVMGGEALIRARLDPAFLADGAVRVYARPLTLLSGERPDRRAVRERLERLGYQETRGTTVGIGEYFLGSRGWVIGRRSFRGAGQPIPAGFAVVGLDSRGRIYGIEDEEGGRLAHFSLEPELAGRILDDSRQDLIPVSLEEVPEALVDALVTVEDQRFFEHGGLDYRRIAAAFAANFRAGRVVQGGSTLTQQLAKNLYLNPRRTITRKLREAFMATALEWRHDKEEILQAYLNTIYLAQDGAVAIHGVGTAAQYFFGKDVSNLDVAECAQLVALIRAPSLYSPFRHPETAVERRNLVLRLMKDADLLTEVAYEHAIQEPLRLRKRTTPVRSARYFLDYVSGELAAWEEEAEASGRGGRMDGSPGTRGIVTTLDLELQTMAERAVEHGLSRLENRFDWLREGQVGEPLQAALVALDPRSGEILAMVGGRDYGVSQFNRAIHARRQPGSAFKPVVAMAALARPRRGVDSSSPDAGRPGFTLASILQDQPLEVETSAGIWTPANYNGQFNGPVTLREALERSLNVPFARLGLAVGPERIVDTAERMGITTPLDPYPSLALGASEVTPLELTRAFGVLAAGGFRADLTTTLGDPVMGTQAFDPAEAYLVTSALRGAVERGTGRGIRDEGFFGDVAAKSGTTNDFRDGWFVGYTPALVVGVWVGFDHGGPLQLPGASVAQPIFTEFLREAAGPDGQMGPWGGGEFSYPGGLEQEQVDPATGLRAGWGCRGEPEVFLEGTAPEEMGCGRYRIGDDIPFDARALRRLLEQGGEEAARWIRRILQGQGR